MQKQEKFNKTFIYKPMRLILDTNVVIDMLHFSDPHTQMLAAGLVSGQWQCFTDTPCLAELERVCAYPEFGLDVAAQQSLLARYQQQSSVCDASGEENYPLPRCRDRDDQKFLILAARCNADLLITRDKQVLRLARHRSLPPPFAIVTAEAAGSLLLSPAENPALLV